MAITKFILLFPTELWKHLSISLYRIFLSLLIALAIGVPLGLLCGLNTLMVSVIVFQVFIAVRDGVREIPNSLFQSIHSLGLGPLDRLKHLIFPAMLPKFFSALRVSLGTSIATLFFAENYATIYGIGYLVINAGLWLTIVKCLRVS